MNSHGTIRLSGTWTLPTLTLEAISTIASEAEGAGFRPGARVSVRPMDQHEGSGYVVTVEQTA